MRDFYFDDQTWAVRYVVVDTGSWLGGRKVLLSPHAFARSLFGRPAPDSEFLTVNLTRDQIEKSPSIDLHKPVSRQYEEQYYRYYNWPVYWQGGSIWGPAVYPGGPPVSFSEAVSTGVPPELLRDHHLRSTKELDGYKIQATDGELGKVADFVMDGENWGIREVVVEAGHWYSGKEVFILPSQISRISYPESLVFVSVSCQDIRQTIENGVVEHQI